jgi:hypothetical protein
MTRIVQAGEAIQPTTLTTFIPIRIKRSSGRKVVVPASNDAAPAHDAPILTALSRAFHWQRLIDEGRVKSGTSLFGKYNAGLTMHTSSLHANSGFAHPRGVQKRSCSLAGPAGRMADGCRA